MARYHLDDGSNEAIANAQELEAFELEVPPAMGYANRRWGELAELDTWARSEALDRQVAQALDPQVATMAGDFRDFPLTPEELELELERRHPLADYR